jgi:hypothetical protein
MQQAAEETSFIVSNRAVRVIPKIPSIAVQIHTCKVGLTVDSCTETFGDISRANVDVESDLMFSPR